MNVYFCIIFSTSLLLSHIPNAKLEEAQKDWEEYDEENINKKTLTPKPKAEVNHDKKKKPLADPTSNLTREEINIYFNNMHFDVPPWNFDKLKEQNHRLMQYLMHGNFEQITSKTPTEEPVTVAWEEEVDKVKIIDWPDSVNLTSMSITTAPDESLKYILLWTKSYAYKWQEMDIPFFGGQQIFIEKRCPYINCYVTHEVSFLGEDISKFDAIVFLGPDVFTSTSVPWKRSPHQKYMFAATESSDNYPMCSNALDGFFNWSWTYKVDSDARWGYIFVCDLHKTIIGPKKNMQWIAWHNMAPIGYELQKKLESKKKAAAWFVSNCTTHSRREDFVKELQTELNKYGLGIDIYGRCAEWECGKERHPECLKMLEKDYFFYLAFENGFSEDYVTEKLLHALQSNTVPIVYGGANYTRFMPDGMYLNARELGVQKLAKTMDHLMRNPEEYYDFFRWKYHYTYHGNKELELDGFCRLCTMLNNEGLMRKTSIYTNFKDWWTPPGRCANKSLQNNK